MKIVQKKWTPEHRWQSTTKPLEGNNADLVFCFGDRDIFSKNGHYFDEVKQMYPSANIVSASTSGNILGTTLEDNCIALTAIAFEKSSKVEIRSMNIAEAESSFSVGKKLADLLPKEGLLHIFLLSDGHLVNGSELVKGITSEIPNSKLISGGLAGDGTRFEKTLVGANKQPKEGEIIAIGFYGKDLKIGIGSFGGWDPFGIERKITKSSNNVLYELDGKSALDLYKKYLGEQSKDLPSSAMLFPLAIRKDENSLPVVRTILSINEHEKSMTFAGDIPEGWYAQLMKANFDRLIDGASIAASDCYEMLGKKPPELAILVSCVGRRIVLDQRTEEEIESVKEIFGEKACLTGFYSYGEIAPTMSKVGCELHNQTMTITTISER